MKDQDKISNECVTSDMLLRYIRGELSSLEKNRVERHIANCEMCSDEFEGLLSMGNPDTIKSVVKELNQRIDNTILEEKANSKPLWSTLIKVAASLVLLVGISSLIYFAAFRETTKQVLSENEMMDIAAPSPILEKPIMLEERAIGGTQNLKIEEKLAQGAGMVKQAEAKMVYNQPTQVKYVAPVVVDSVKVEVVQDEMAMEAIAEAQVEQIDTGYENAELEEVVVTGYGVSKKAESRDVAERKRMANTGAVSGVSIAKGLSSKNTYSDQKNKAVELFNNRKYKNALSIISKLKSDYPSNDSLIYYTALCNYHLGKYEKSIAELENLINKPQSELYSLARWYYALSLKGEKKTDDAIRVLKQIIDTDSALRIDAEKELNKIINP